MCGTPKTQARYAPVERERETQLSPQINAVSEQMETPLLNERMSANHVQAIELKDYHHYELWREHWSNSQNHPSSGTPPLQSVMQDQRSL